MIGYLAFAALFWMLILSIGVIALAHGSDNTKRQYREVAWVFVALAWVTTIGVVVYELIRSLF